ncbi:MAG: S-layer homology domain-containing protein, partial [Firmicutes bacterium]|nr:S-layer homology domain-containing protein [Bacillota bacterium]
LWAVDQKVTSGTSATTFSPNATCTRGQIVTFLYNATH